MMSSCEIHYREFDDKLELIYTIGFNQTVVQQKEHEILSWWREFGFEFTQTEDVVNYDHEDLFHYEKRVYESDGVTIEAFLAWIGDGGAITCTIDQKHKALALIYKLTFQGDMVVAHPVGPIK